MSKRREVGQIVRKKANAGFIGQPLIVKIVNLEVEGDEPWFLPWDYCFLCKDEDCKEWANCEVVIDGKLTGDYVYHVSECQMDDI